MLVANGSVNDIDACREIDVAILHAQKLLAGIMFCDITDGNALCVLEGAPLFDASTDWLSYIPHIFQVHHNEPNPLDNVKVIAARVHCEYDLSELGDDLFRMANQHLHIELP